MKPLFTLLLTASLACAQVVTFTQQPILSKQGDGSWRITFAMSAPTDVAVSIVNIGDSTVLRHLIAGALGANAPQPLLKDSLRQTLIWDGKDDNGIPVSIADNSLRVRVRAGMTTQLVSLLGGEPYSMGSASATNQYISGILADTDGSVYIAGAPATFWHEHYGETFLTIRKFDKNGNYIKTVFPVPANLQQSDVAGWGVVNNPDGSFTPKNTNTSLPMFTRTKLGYMSHAFNSKLQYINREGKLVFGDIDIMAFGKDGKLPGSGASQKLITSPAYATASPSYSMQGEACLTPLRNGKLLLTGFFNFTGTKWNTSQTAPDTNYYRDGKVYIIDTAVKAAVTWLAIDSVPASSTERLSRLGGGAFYSALQGTAVDSAGRVYVCDRLHQRVGVYDSGAQYLGALSVMHPHRVQVCGRTGAVYVITQSQAAWAGANTNTVKLVKFAPFASGGAPVCTLPLAAATMGRSGRSATSSLAISDIDGQVTVWVGIWGQGIRLYLDNGATLSLVKDMRAVSLATNELGIENPTPDRLAVDRKTENLYFNNSWYNLYKITDWTAPRPRICSTTTNARLYASDLALGPNGFLYVFYGNHYNAAIRRFTMTEGRHAPANWTNTGSNMLTPYVSSRFAPCSGMRGLSVAQNGDVAVMAIMQGDRGRYSLGVYPDAGSSDTSWGVIRVDSLPGLSGGVKYDPQGNLYFGAGLRQTTLMAPAQFLSDTGFRWGVGSIIRYDGTASGAMTGSPVATASRNASIIYDLPLSPFSADRLGGCICRSPRFDVDPYGRLFVPDAITCQVSVGDNAGNRLHRFGQYGNIDSRGSLPGLPGQQVVAGSDIPLAWPTSVAASEDYIYVADYMNYRIARIKMIYTADNMPGFTGPPAEIETASYWRTPVFTLTSGPVPFSGSTTVGITLPDHARVSLSVFDAKGRLVNRLTQGRMGPGNHRFKWNGKDALGRTLSAGVYVFRLTADNKILFARTILAK